MSSIVDDLKLMHVRDAQDALGLAEKSWQQLSADIVYQPEFAGTDIDTIVYAGMGGSALAGLYVQAWPTTPVPFEVIRGYELPAYVGPRSLVIVASYSGNTEETLAVLTQAEQKDAQIVVISGGGTLTELAVKKGYPLARIPQLGQPRFAVFAMFAAVVDLLGRAGICDPSELMQAAEYVHESAQSWLPTVPATRNLAKQIAQECIGKSVVIYSGPKLAAAAYKWKISFNENAKQIAWTGQYPEVSHNELIGWSKQPVSKPYAVIDLRSQFEHPQVQKSFDLADTLLSGKRPHPLVVEAQGASLLEQLLWVSNLGDFVTIYTAVLNGIDPSPVPTIEKFKRELTE